MSNTIELMQCHCSTNTGVPRWVFMEHWVLETRHETRCPEGLSYYCLASCTRHQCTTRQITCILIKAVCYIFLSCVKQTRHILPQQQPLCHGQQLSELSSPSNLTVKSYGANTDFGFVCTVTLPLEI